MEKKSTLEFLKSSLSTFWRLAVVILLSIFFTGVLQAQWAQIGIDIDGETDNDVSGWSVSLSADGSTVAIGAINNAGGGYYRGHVRVYKNISGTWAQQGADIDGEADSGSSSWSVSLSADGSTVAIGAPYNTSAGGGYYHGHVRVYKNISGTWTQQGADIEGESSYDLSGYSVSLSADGSTVAIGAVQNAGGGYYKRGHVRVYKNISGTWTQQGLDIDGEAAGDNSGFSVSLSADGSTVAIGAPYNTSAGGGFTRGHVRVYKNISGTWAQQGADIDGEANSDYSGYSVSLSADGSTVAIGAPYNPGGHARGQVRVFKNLSGIWTQLGLDIDGEADGDNSGFSVSLSANGSTVAIGAPYNTSAGGGFRRGHGRVYKYVTGTWTQHGADIDGEANNDNSGRSVSLSADGFTIAIGAVLNSGGGINRGHVRVYYYDGCPNDPNKTEPGICGCGVSDIDSDQDGAVDCNESCPNDASKTSPGQCGCGIPDRDDDHDGTANCNDMDDDNDGQSDLNEITCGSDPLNAQSVSPDNENDNLPDCVDPDDDNDGVADNHDNCPTTVNSDQSDLDVDGLGDACDPIVNIGGLVNQMNIVIMTLSLTQGLTNALVAKLNDAMDIYCNGNTSGALNKLNAFINQVQGQSGNQIPLVTANYLITQAQALITDINNSTIECPTAPLKLVAPTKTKSHVTNVLFPNPAVNETWLDLSAHTDITCSVRLTDTRGVLLLEWNLKKAGYELLRMNLSDLASGLYFVHVQVKGQTTETLKLLVE